MTFLSYFNSQFTLAQHLDLCLRLVISCLCGAAIGIERSRRFKEAGIRTHIIVCCASALMMVVSKYGFVDLVQNGMDYAGTKGADPARIAAQVVSGISFLCAGVIFKNAGTIKGLTTAAGVWITAGIAINVWTVNDMAALEKLHAWNCEGVITNFPGIAKSWLDTVEHA